jgi:putative membrane-bound dehydrogenase-like protein
MSEAPPANNFSIIGAELVMKGWIVLSAYLATSVVILPARAADRVQTATSDVELERVAPLAPDDALATFEVADGFRIEQVAVEPLVVDPVAMAFDEHGRLYIVEMRGYSEQDKARLGRVRRLLDEDGDGRFETSQVFADHLSWPTAVICYDGGVFIGNAPDILYCKDTDGDGVADESRVVFTGFGRSNVQGLLNSFHWGLDGRIYGSSSSTGGRITRPESNAAPVELRGRDFAFDPKTLDFEPLTGGGQHGMSFNRWGDRFVCHNSDHLQAIVFEERYLGRNPYHSVVSARRSIAADGPQAAVYRASPVEAWRVARTELRLAGLAPGPVEGGGQPAGYFTSATGVTVYEGGLWKTGGETWALVADVGSNLIHRKRLVPAGVTYRGERIDKKSEFVRSTDIWFRPVQMAIGPEGALYIADMYREVIEHPKALPPELKSQLDLTSGNNRGRIYRIVPANGRIAASPFPAALSSGELVNRLDHANIWQRTTASRLLFEQDDPDAVPLLRSQISASERPEGRIAALYTLHAVKALNEKGLFACLDDSHPQVRRHAVRLSEPLLDPSAKLRNKVISLASDPDPVVRFPVALSLGETSHSAATPALAKLINDNSNMPDIVDAALTSIGTRAGGILQALLDISQGETLHADRALSAIVMQIARQRRERDVAILLDVLRSPDAAIGRTGVATLLKALNELPENAMRSDDLPQWTELQQLHASMAESLVRDARQILERRDVSTAERIAAIEHLAFGDFEEQHSTLEEFLSPRQEPAIHAAVLATCANFDTPEVAKLVLGRRQWMAPDQRSQAIDLLLSRESWALALLREFERDGLALTMLEPAHIARLENFPSTKVRELTSALRRQDLSDDRRKVFEEYRKTSLAGGDALRGKEIFAKNCATCHELSGKGHAVGPNLASMVSRGAESVLFNILTPSGEVEPRYLEYVLLTVEGQVLTGMIVAETSTAVTLRSADDKTTTVLRVDIDELQNTGKSLMPDGFERMIDPGSMADLLAYLQQAATEESAP